MTLKLKSLALRSISGIIYISLIIGVLLLKNAIPFFILFSFVSIFLFIEFNNLTKINRLNPFRVFLDTLFGLWLLFIVFLYSFYSTKFKLIFIVPYLIYIIYSISRPIFLDLGSTIKIIGNTIFSHIYVLLPIIISILTSNSNHQFNGNFILLVFIILWVNDTGAYLIGSSFGKHRLYSKLSPKKSVEGLLAGIFFSILTIVLINNIFPNIEWGISFNLISSIIFSIIISIFATLGDLFESALKREALVKDSGKIIPGHGGFLDRFDSFLFAMPIAGLFYLIHTYII